MDYPCDAGEYEMLERIGEGACATVRHARVKSNGCDVAIKIFDLRACEDADLDLVRREMTVLALEHHPNLARSLASFTVDEQLCVVMPLCQVGSFARILATISPTGFKNEAVLATILKQTLDGLVYLHKDNVIHRDIKAGNVLLTADGDVQLSDFGVSGMLVEHGRRKESRNTFTGTPCYMAPEVLLHDETHGYNCKADVWSFGILALELAYGRAPYSRYPPMKAMLETIEKDPPTGDVYRDYSYTFCDSFHSMVRKCLCKDVTKRFTSAQLLKHRFFRKYSRHSSFLVEQIVRRMNLQQQISLTMPAL